MAGGFQAGSIVGSLVLDKTKWTQSVAGVKKDTKAMGGMSDKMSAGFKKAGKAMTIAGGLIVGTLGTMVKKYVEVGDWVDKMSKRTGFAATTLSELAYAADISGASLTDVEKAVKRMAKTIIDAGDGLATYVRAFKRIGIEVKELDGLNPEEQFFKIGEAIASVEDPTLRAAAAQDIFGRAGTTLLPLFAEGEKGLKALREEAHKLGIVFDEEAAAKAAKLKDAQTALTASLKGLGFTLADSLVPVLTKFIGKITDVMKKVIAWVKENPKLTATIVKIVGGVGALMLVLGPLAMMLPGLAIMFSALTGPIGLVIVALALLVKAAFDAHKTFKESMEGFREEMKLTGEEMSKFAMVTQSARKALKLSALDFDANRLILIKVHDGLRKVKGVMSMAKIASKGLSGAISFLSTKFGEVTEKSDAAWAAWKIATGTAGEFTTAAKTLKATIGKLPVVLGMTEFQARALKMEWANLLDVLDQEVMGETWEVIEDGVLWLARMKDEGEDTGGVMEEVFGKIGLDYKALTEGVEDETTRVTEIINPLWANLGRDLSRSFGDAFKDILTKGSDFSDALNLLFGGLVNSIKGFFGQMVTDFLANNVFDFMKTAAKEATDVVASTAKDFIGGATEVSKSAAGAISGIWTGIGAAVGTFLAGIITGKGGPSSTDSWHFKQIWINTNALIPMEGALDAVRDHTLRIANQTHGVPGKLDILNRWQSKIYSALTNIPSAAHGMEATFSSPSLIRVGDASVPERVSVRPQQMSISMNAGNTPVILKVDGKELAHAVIKHLPELSADGYVSMHNRASKDY